MTVSDWVRKDFRGVGITQYPPGPHLAAIAAYYSGSVLLCIDVSSSMAGVPLAEATRGGADFLAEARAADYEVGLVLWNTGVAAAVPIGADEQQLRTTLRTASSHGGTDLRATLGYAISALAPRSGDRVVCVFGDGDVGEVAGVSALVREARSHGIRFVVRGLGANATDRLSSLLTPEEDRTTQVVADVAGLARGIASMARSLRARGAAD